MAGKPLADGFFAVIYALKGDLDYLTKSLKLRHYNSNEMCDLCPATRRKGSDQRMVYCNFNADARWKTMCYGSSEWRRLYSGHFLHWICSLEGVSNLSIEPDELHVLHLGVSMYAIGSVLHILVHEVMDDTAEVNMKAVWGDVCVYYSDHNPDCQYSNLSLSSFSDRSKPFDDFPMLKGKGAEVKDLLPAVCDCWSRRGARHGQFSLINETMTALLEVQDILRDHAKDLIIPEDKVVRLQTVLDTFLLGYQRLAYEAEVSGAFLWSMPSKFHWLYHLGQKCMFLNPRRTNCFLDEDFVGKMKILLQSCASGTELHKTLMKMAEKYQWGLHFLGKDN